MTETEAPTTPAVEPETPPPAGPTTQLLTATAEEGAGQPCDMSCDKGPITVGEAILKASPPAGAEDQTPVYAHEVCYLKHAMQQQFQQAATAMLQAQQHKRALEECHALLACVVAANGGRARVKPQDIERAREAKFELAITDTPDKGKKLVLKRALILVADVVPPAEKPS